MPFLERKDPQAPCQPDGAHHPHILICGDYECGCEELFGKPFEVLVCCVCRQDWPCATKIGHVHQREWKAP